jgi:hypothetical protein
MDSKVSYIPDRNQRELRELVRYCMSIIEERARPLSTILHNLIRYSNTKVMPYLSIAPVIVKLYPQISHQIGFHYSLSTKMK